MNISYKSTNKRMHHNLKKKISTNERKLPSSEKWQHEEYKEEEFGVDNEEENDREIVSAHCAQQQQRQ